RRLGPVRHHRRASHQLRVDEALELHALLGARVAGTTVRGQRLAKAPLGAAELSVAHARRPLGFPEVEDGKRAGKSRRVVADVALPAVPIEDESRIVAEHAVVRRAAPNLGTGVAVSGGGTTTGSERAEA